MQGLKERGRRHSVRLEGSATRSDGTIVPAVVTDLSLDGCCLTGSFAIGERLCVQIPRIGKLDAVVRWSFMGRAGARFDRDQREARPHSLES